MIHAIALLATLLDPRPPVSEASRFPPRHVCQANIDFNHAYRAKMEEQCQWLARAEAEQLFEVWDLLDTIQRWGGRYPSSTRDRLSELRDRLGWDAFYRGRMPPPVPTWRFREESPAPAPKPSPLLVAALLLARNPNLSGR